MALPNERFALRKGFDSSTARGFSMDMPPKLRQELDEFNAFVRRKSLRKVVEGFG
jgi:hypothetical protein